MQTAVVDGITVLSKFRLQDALLIISLVRAETERLKERATEGKEFQRV